MNYWLIADSHLGHNKLQEPAYGARPASSRSGGGTLWGRKIENNLENGLGYFDI